MPAGLAKGSARIFGSKGFQSICGCSLEPEPEGIHVACKVNGYLGTVASGTMGEQRGNLRPSKYIGLDITLIVLGKFVYLCPDYLCVVFPFLGRAFLYKLK